MTQANPVRICVLTSVHQPFDGRIFHRECQSLAKAGHQVTLVAPADFQRREKKGVTVLGVPRPTNRFGRPLVWWRLYRLARSLQPDVIHFHDPELLGLVPLFRLMLGRRVRIVYDVHEYFVDSLASKYWIPAWLRPLVGVMARGLERLLVRGVDGIVCVVDGQKPLYSGFAGPMATVRNLPFATLFKDAEPHSALDVKGFKLIYVGLILPKRGIDVLLEAMRQLRERGQTDIYLFLIGPDTSSAYTRQVRDFTAVHQLTDQVRLLGFVPHHQLKHYLTNADVGLAPGQRTRQYNQPALSTKLFEYMLFGLPILSADFAYNPIYIKESNCGVVVSTSDASAWADAILWFRDHPEEARAMGKRGREMVLARYTWEQEQSHLLSFYDALFKDENTPTT